MKDTTNNLLKKMLYATKAKSRNDLAKYLGISSQAVYNALSLDKIPHNWIAKIAEQTNMSIEWFFEGEEDNIQEESTIIQIPIVEARLSAGTGSFITNDSIENSLPFDSKFIVTKGNPENMVIMRVMGDSMQPEIMDNDYVMIDQSKTEIQPNRIFAVGFEDCIYLKRIDLLPKKVVLKSVNPAYPPVVLDIQEDMASLFRVIGKVLWVGREYN